MKLLNFTQFVSEGLGILNTGSDGIGNVSTHDNIFTFTPKQILKRKIKGSKTNTLAQSVTQPPLTDPTSYVNNLLQ
jgi:hypothetical protein